MMAGMASGRWAGAVARAALVAWVLAAWAPRIASGWRQGPAQGTPTPPDAPNLVAVRGYWRQFRQGELGSCFNPSGPPGGLMVCVSNRGPVAAGPFALAADDRLDKVLARASGLASGEEICLPAGLAVSRGIVVDALGEVAEGDEGDNWLPSVPLPSLPTARACAPTSEPPPGVPSIPPGPRPDLVGTGRVALRTEPSGCWRPEAPKAWVSQLMVANEGNADAPASRMSADEGGVTLWDVGPLPAGAVVRRSAGDIPGGPARVDADGAVAELDEANNAFSVKVGASLGTCTPGPPPSPGPRAELRLERAELRAMGFDETCARRQARLEVWASVANVGTGVATGILVEANGQLEPVELPRLDPGQRATVRFEPPVSWVRVRPLPGEDPSDNALGVAPSNPTPAPTCAPGMVTPVAETPAPGADTPTPVATTPDRPAPAGGGLWLPCLGRESANDS